MEIDFVIAVRVRPLSSFNSSILNSVKSLNGSNSSSLNSAKSSSLNSVKSLNNALNGANSSSLNSVKSYAPASNNNLHSIIEYGKEDGKGVETIMVVETKQSVRDPLQCEKIQRSFQAHKVYQMSSLTVDIHVDLIDSLVPFAMQGGFANVLAYGQTGSGKTFTMSDISQLVAHSIFASKKLDVTIDFSVLEIYGTQLRDLLTNNTNIKLIENIQGGVEIVNIHRKRILVESDLEEAYSLAWKSRQTQSTVKNDTSSRSHAIFRFEFHSKTDQNASIGILQLLDLAGSERAASDAKLHSKDRFKESIEINKSLMTLKECIRQRCIAHSSFSKTPHIPYRGSKLTLLLKEAFELSSIQPTRTIFIATVSPLQIDTSATINTLRYASSLLVASPKLKLDQIIEPDNIFFWTHEQILNWLSIEIPEFSESQLKTVIPYENGMNLTKVPELEFIRRILSANVKFGEKRAKSVYLAFWKLVVESRTKSRQDERKAWSKQYKAQSMKKDLEYVRIFESHANNKY